MEPNHTSPNPDNHAEHIRVRGIVQGVGFRPAVWNLAQECQLRGQVSNDGDGVLIELVAEAGRIDHFVDALYEKKPPLARIDSIERTPTIPPANQAASFSIIHSTHSQANTGITADAATCDACLDEIFDPQNRRFHYPFTNCTHCGPRLSIIHGIPYDRAQTSMSVFNLCSACLQEYKSPTDRRFHAQPNACPECGPEIWLEDSSGKKVSTSSIISHTAKLLQQGFIIGIKGIGGVHLAVDASHKKAVQTLRERKQRPRKPFALMAKNSAMIKQYCHITNKELELLKSPAAPIVLLERQAKQTLPEAIAPSQNTLGMMLPYSPLHHLLLHELDAPIVLTSGNVAHEPQCIGNQQALSGLQGIADYFLLHNRDIENRVDDSVVRVMGGKPQFLRRARGYAPESLPLPDGFGEATDILAMGGELKNTFCFIKKGQAILSQHMGDLENYACYEDYRHNLSLYKKLYQHQEKHTAIDAHPEYIPSKLGRELAENSDSKLHLIQHHHAHIAACLADNDYPLAAEPVLGIALDGLGYGSGYGKSESNHPLWGGEFLLADYRQSTQLAHFKPIALLGGSVAMKQPWRNTYAHLQSCLGWQWVSDNYPELDLVKQLSSMPLATFDGMLKKEINSPLASSAGRLFDAVAAAVGICREEIQYEGQAAIELEASITFDSWQQAKESAYCFSLVDNVLDPAPMWKALLQDLSDSTPTSLISARFHYGLALAVQALVTQLAKEHKTNTIALSGGVFQNKTLFEAVKNELEHQDFKVLVHRHVPANDGGLALGQAVVTAAKIINKH